MKKLIYDEFISQITDESVKKHLKEDLGWDNKRISKQIQRFNKNQDIYDEFKYVLFNYLVRKEDNDTLSYAVEEPVEILGYTARDLCYKFSGYNPFNKVTQEYKGQKKDAEVFDIMIELRENDEKTLKKYALEKKEKQKSAKQKKEIMQEKVVPQYMISIVYGTNKPENVDFDELYIDNNYACKIKKYENHEKRTKIFIHKEQFRKLLEHHKKTLESFYEFSHENNLDYNTSSLDYSIEYKQKIIALGCENANEEVKKQVKNLLKVITNDLLFAIRMETNKYIENIVSDIVDLKPFQKFTFAYFFDKYGIDDKKLKLEKTIEMVRQLDKLIKCEDNLGIAGLPYNFTFERTDYDNIFGE